MGAGIRRRLSGYPKPAPSTSSGFCHEATCRYLHLPGFEPSCARPQAPASRQSAPTANGSAAKISNGCGGCSRRRSMTTHSIASSATFQISPILLQKPPQRSLTESQPRHGSPGKPPKDPQPDDLQLLGVGKAFVRKYRNKFDSSGVEAMFRRIPSRTARSTTRNCEAPSSACFTNRQPTMASTGRPGRCHSCAEVLKNNGTQVGPAVVSKMIKAAGYKLRKAKVVLRRMIRPTRKSWLAFARSYRTCSPNEAFFSIDEYGPLQSKPSPDARWHRPEFSRRSHNGRSRAAA